MTAMDEKLVKIHNKIDKILDDIVKENQKEQIRSAAAAEEGGGSGGKEENLVQVLLRIQQSESLDITITNDNIKAGGESIYKVASFEAMSLIALMVTLLASFVVGYVRAGTDTSSTTTEWAMIEMMRNPKVMEKA